MRLFLLTALTMCAFAANSVLNRLAIQGGWIGPFGFAAIRLASGAAALAMLALVRGRGLSFGGWRRLVGAAALLTYMLGFSLAYLALPAGVGALILFGGVQVTMFAGALLSGEALPPRRWAGAGLALAGLGWLLWPSSGGGGAAAPLPALSMAAAAVGWGLYSLAGRREGDALAATAANFILAAPVAIAVAAGGGGAAFTGPGIGLALVSGIVTSGLGYALWYAVLPALGAGRAAVAQLTVPVIAALGGVALLGEAPGLRFLTAAALVLGGVGLATAPGRRAAA